jgi:hypothetical protein
MDLNLRGGAHSAQVSLCVPTAVEVSRLTRWQLVFEPFRSDNQWQQVWLARGAPKRWFRHPSGFGVGSLDGAYPIPLNGGGAISFHVSTEPAYNATYTVTVKAGPRKSQRGTRFVLRWPGVLLEHSLSGGGTVVHSEPSNGLVVVVPVWRGSVASFGVSGRWQ